MIRKSIKKITFTDSVLFAALLLIGGFHEYISCLLSVAMSTYLAIRIWRGKKITVNKDILTSAAVALCLGYGITCLWAVDTGIALIGFLKFLPIVLYVFCLQQEEKAGVALDVLPYMAAVMTILSIIGMQILAFSSLFTVAGRLAGFFQYPNTFAIFLLVCELLLLKKAGKKVWDYVVLLVLLAGLLYTGSRTAFVVALTANIAMLFCLSKKQTRKIFLIGIGVFAVLAVILMLGKDSILRRYLSISLTADTFVGRVLYWIDALQLLLKYPFGMGYMGYFYTQQAVQTGVYTVAYAHNDFLQLILDIGWVPSIFCFVALLKWFFQKTVLAEDKIIVGALCVHSFFDFNLQFIAVFLLLVLLLSQDKTSKKLVVKPKALHKVGCVAVILVSLYVGTSLLLAHLGAREAADKMYPYNTQNKLLMLEQCEDVKEANQLADEILEQNTMFFAPYSVKAKYYYSIGDFASVIQHEKEAIARAPFRTVEYEEYCKMLMIGITLYEQNGNLQSAEVCKQELIAVCKQWQELPQGLSKLGAMIKDQPNTEIPTDVLEYISKIGG